MRAKTLFGALVLILATAFGAASQAAPITYSFTGTASGTLGGTAFNDKSFTITGAGDTDVLKPFGPGIYLLALQSVSVAVDGLGSGLAVNAFNFFVNQTVSEVGLLENLSGDVFDVSAGLFAAYDGISAVPGESVAVDYLAVFATTAGLFSLDAADGVRFSASIGSGGGGGTLPEAATLWLAGIGALAAVLGSRQSRRKGCRPLASA